MGILAEVIDTGALLLAPLGRAVLRIARSVIAVMGSLAAVMLVLAFTRVPFEMQQWLGRSAGTCGQEVDAIAVFGGGGMPSAADLMRLDRAARIARHASDAEVYVLHVNDPGTLAAMRNELVMKGVEPARIHVVAAGNNTREQVLWFARHVPEQREGRVAVVSSPEHQHRAVHAMRRVGVMGACGAPAWDQALFIDLAYRQRDLGGRRYMPDVGGTLALRYDVWNRITLQVSCLREALAILYYRLNGWM